MQISLGIAKSEDTQNLALEDFLIVGISVQGIFNTNFISGDNKILPEIPGQQIPVWSISKQHESLHFKKMA